MNIGKNCSGIIHNVCSQTRKGENAQAFLQGFTGYLVRDGYSGYHKVKGVKHCGCLIHCRRYFVNALPKEKKAHPSSVAAEAVRYFDRIYHEEGLLANMTAEERYKERLVKIKPLLEAFCAAGNGAGQRKERACESSAVCAA